MASWDVQSRRIGGNLFAPQTPPWMDLGKRSGHGAHTQGFLVPVNYELYDEYDS